QDRCVDSYPSTCVRRDTPADGRAEVSKRPRLCPTPVGRGIATWCCATTLSATAVTHSGSAKAMTLRGVRTATWTIGICLWLATPALAPGPGQGGAERARSLQGEPIVVIVSLENVGDEAFGYCACEADI